MMKNTGLIVLLISAILLQGCTNTFMGSVLVLSFRDIILYVVFAFILAVLIALVSSREKRRQAFWLWFIISLLLTPLAGFIYLLVTLTKKD